MRALLCDHALDSPQNSSAFRVGSREVVLESVQLDIEIVLASAPGVRWAENTAECIRVSARAHRLGAGARASARICMPSGPRWLFASPSTRRSPPRSPRNLRGRWPCREAGAQALRCASSNVHSTLPAAFRKFKHLTRFRKSSCLPQGEGVVVLGRPLGDTGASISLRVQRCALDTARSVRRNLRKLHTPKS